MLLVRCPLASCRVSAERTRRVGRARLPPSHESWNRLGGSLALPAYQFSWNEKLGRCRESDILSGSSRSSVRRGPIPGCWDFQGITPVSNSSWNISDAIGILVSSGETESGSAGTQPDKGYPGLRCANGASDPWLPMPSGVALFRAIGHRSDASENPVFSIRKPNDFAPTYART